MHRNLKLLAAFHFFTDLDFLAPVSAIYFSQVTGSFALGMSVVSWMMIFSALFEIPTGIFSDRIGRKNTIICGTISSLLSAVSLALGTTYWHLFASALFAGLSRAFQSGNTEAFIYETLQESKQEKEYHHFLGKLSSVFQFALVVSALSGSIIASRSFRILLWINVLPRVAMLVISIFFTEPDIQSKKSTNIFTHIKTALALFRNNSKLRYLTFATTIQFAVGEAAHTFRSVFIRTVWPLWAVGISSVISHVGAAFSYFFSGNIIDRYGEKKVLVFEVYFNRLINLIALLFPNPLSPALMGLSSVTYGAGDVARKHLSQQEFDAGKRATMASLIALSQNIAFAVISYALGLLADVGGPVRALIVAHIVLLVPAWFYKRIFRTA